MFRTLFFPLSPEGQVILKSRKKKKSWEEKNPHKRPISQMRKPSLRKAKIPAGFQSGSDTAGPCSLREPCFLPPGLAGLGTGSHAAGSAS